MLYMIFCEDAAGSLEKRLQERPAHLEYLYALQKENRLVMAGPLYHQETQEPYPANVCGSLIIGEFADIASAKSWAEADPYAIAKVFAKVNVKPFRKVLP